MTGLQKQVIPVQFGQGIDQKTDQKLLVPGKLSVLENCVFKKIGRIDKRNGHKKINNIKMDGTEISNPESLAVFNDELLEYAGQNLYSYSSGAEKWVSKGSLVSAIVTSNSIVKNTAAQTQVDSATNGGVTVYAWEDSRGGVRASVIDEEDGAFLLADMSLDSSASCARCLAFQNYLYVFYYKSGSLYAQRLNPELPTGFDSAVLISDTVNTSNPTYDVIAYGTLRMFFAHNVQGSSATLLGWIDETPAVYTGVLATFQVAEASTNSLALLQGPNNTFYVAYHNTTDGVRCTILNNGGGTIHAPTTIEAITATTVVNITGYQSSSSQMTLLYEKTASTVENQVIRQNTISSSGTAGTASDYLRSVGLWTKAFSYTDSNGLTNTYVGVTRDSPLQATYFLTRTSDGLVVAKQQYANGSGLTSRPILQNAWNPAAAIYAYAILVKNQIVSENGTVYTPTGIMRAKIDFTNQEIFTAAQLGNNLHIVGGVLSIYDGLDVVEHGFHLYPEVMSASQSGSAGVAVGSYQYIALYEWTDNYGQIHRSAPSVALPFSVTTTAGNVSVVIDTLRLTQKKGTRSNVSIVLYRTENNGSVFYRVSSISSPTFNDPTADSVTIVDALADSDIISHEILYTVGGSLDNFPPPACSTIAVYKNRIFLGGLEDGNDIWYSKEHKNGLPVEFSDQLLKSVEMAGGDVTALYVMDDKLLAFKDDRYYYTFGDGPNDTGQGGDFAEFQFVTADVGCTNASSIARFPQGIMLKTQKGIYAIDTSLNPAYIGSEVEDYNSLSITSAVLVPDNNQVKFTTSTGPALVYDYFMRQWSVFTNHSGTDAVLWQNNYVLLKSNGAIWQEDKTTHKDDGASFQMRLATGWISMASVVGFQRVYKYAILGEYKSPHQLRVSVSYDYSDAYRDSQLFNPDTALGISHYGDSSPYGNSAVFGGENSAYRYTSRLRIQKCQAIKFLIEEVITSAVSGTQESFNLTTLGLLVGMKQGMGKLKASQNLGV